MQYAEEHVPGSPFTVHVTGEATSGRLLQEVTRRREAIEVREVGKPCELSLKIPGTMPLLTVFKFSSTWQALCIGAFAFNSWVMYEYSVQCTLMICADSNSDSGRMKA